MDRSTTRVSTHSLSGMIQKRLLGDLELDDDGSFHVLVPPNTPIQLQIVDRDGMALHSTAAAPAIAPQSAPSPPALK